MKDKLISYLNQLNHVNEDFQELANYAKIHNVPIIKAEGLNILKFLVIKNKAKRILEIGTAIGYSALSLASVFEGQVDTIERNPEMVKLAKANIEKYGYTYRINLIEADALLVDFSLLKDNYDLIFIDAAKGQYPKFFNMFAPLLAHSGIIVTDNIIFHESVLAETSSRLAKKIDEYNKFLSSHPEYRTIFLASGDGLAITFKKD
ncbi:MAG: O-methyltransferase [Erysipelotrichales bacterium]|nr:O-methyltransferase [Erysipelotrichales bacterium]